MNLPKGWKLLSFSEAFKDRTGGQQKIKKNDYLASGNLPIIDQGQQFVAGFTNNLNFQCNIELPCILFGDHTKKFKFVEKPFALGADGVKVLETNKNIDTKFAFHYLQTLYLPDVGYSRHFRFLKRTVIPVPPIASQRRIANILDKADEIVRKRKEAIALTEQLQKSIFLDMFGDPVINPKGWEVEELNNVISIISGQVDPKVEPFIDMPHIGGENLQSNTNNIQNIKTPRELKLKSGKYLFQSGNVLYSKIRPYLNQVVITDFSGVCSADIYPLRVIETKIKNDFLIYLLRSKFFLDYAQKHSTRTNIPKINRPTLLSFRFPCPPINIQKDFSDKCNKITQIQKNFNQYLTESENLFNSLLQKAFKGEL